MRQSLLLMCRVGLLALPASAQVSIEFRGMSSNVAKNMKAYMSSQETGSGVEGADLGPSLTTDGSKDQRLFLGTGCGQTVAEKQPWWYVDLTYSIPIALVRIFGRNDQDQTYGHQHASDLEVRVGESTKWQENEACAYDVPLLGNGRGVSVANCIAQGRYVFIVAAKATNQPLAICEVEVRPRGPRTVVDWLGTIGRGLKVEIEGQSLHQDDRIRVIEPTHLCGSTAAFGMDKNLVDINAPYGERHGGDKYKEHWDNIVVKTFGFFKVCWCSGLTPGGCKEGKNFPFIAGYIVMSGELRTVVGNGKPQIRLNSGTKFAEGATDVDTTRMGNASGVVVADDGKVLYYSESHRIRKVDLQKTQGQVTTIIGGFAAGHFTNRMPGEYAKLRNPSGLAICDLAGPNRAINGGRQMIPPLVALLIADTDNNVIRAYDIEKDLIWTLVGTGKPGYSGDYGLPIEAELSWPAGVACQQTKGVWISDTGNNAIRMVIPDYFKASQLEGGMWDFEKKAAIVTIVGGQGAGFSPVGSWSEGAKVYHPQQLAISKDYGFLASSLAWAEERNAVARYMPLVAETAIIKGNILDVAGDGKEGWLKKDRPPGGSSSKTIQMRSPVGVAAAKSTVFVSEARNHRIIMVPVLEYTSLGCWNENSGGNPFVPLIEDHPLVQFEGDEVVPPRFKTASDDSPLGVSTRPQAVFQCAKAALKLGYLYFAVRGGGLCASSASARDRYMVGGRAQGLDGCTNGLGGKNFNNVYKIVEGSAYDLVGRIYYIVGKALSTQVQYNAEPVAAYYGDEETSWDASACADPQQMARDETTGNLYFVDRGNYRLRVIFGSMGPRPFNQMFTCRNDDFCTLSITGNALGDHDRIGFIKDVVGATCGRQELEVQFPKNTTKTQGSSVFQVKEFKVGRLRLTEVGDFKICYCNFGGHRKCNIIGDFDFVAGTVGIDGPNAGQHLFINAGVPFDLTIFGRGFHRYDRFRIFDEDTPCGGTASTIVDNEALVPNRTEGSDVYESWAGLVVSYAAELKVCWCSGSDDAKNCSTDVEFDLQALELHVLGPKETNYTVESNTGFDLSIHGARDMGGFKITDRVRLVDTQLGSCQEDVPLTLWDALPFDAVACALSSSSARWCGVTINVTGEYHICWCGSALGCNESADFRVHAGYVHVIGGSPAPGTVTPGPWFRPAPPLAPFDTAQGWPLSIAGSTYSPQTQKHNNKIIDITVHAYTRVGVEGADSIGPIFVSICETITRCLAPLEIRDLTVWTYSVQQDSRTLEGKGTKFRPNAILVEAGSSDAWLADFVDVSIEDIDVHWRRFPINRWLMNPGSGGSLEGSWWELSPPPRPLHPRPSMYLITDVCGGCPLGFTCVEQERSALELARSNDVTQTEWICKPICGDGAVMGSEQCDDGNLQNLDGCDSKCNVEDQFECFTEHLQSVSFCQPTQCSTDYDKNDVGLCGSSPLQQVMAATADACRRWDQSTLCASDIKTDKFIMLAELFADPSKCEESVLKANQRDELRLCGNVAAWPAAVHTALADEGRALVVSFDAALSIDGEETCATMFSSATISLLGDGAICKLASPRYIMVRVGLGAQLGLPGAGLRSVGILGGILEYRSLVPASKLANSVAPTQNLLVGSAGESLSTPQVILKGPAIVTAGCGSITLDASSSVGSGNRQWAKIEWSCAGVACEPLISGILPNSCSSQTFETGVGLEPCGESVTFSEFVTADILRSGVDVNIELALTNVAGLTGVASHRLSATQKRVPNVISHSPSFMKLPADPNAQVRFELSAMPAAPSTVSTCEATTPGPISVTWRAKKASGVVVSSIDVTDFADFSVPTETLLVSRFGVLEGTLGEYAVPGDIWYIAARVTHGDVLAPEATAAPVFVLYTIEIESLVPLAVHLDAPEEVSTGCAFNVQALTSGGGSNQKQFLWQCTREDFMDGAAPLGSDRCANIARLAVGGNLVFDTPLAEGIYRIDVYARQPGAPLDGSCASPTCATATVMVSVRPNIGPAIRFLEPTVPVVVGDSGAGSQIVRVRADLGDLSVVSCAFGALEGALIAVASAPGSTAPMTLEARVLAKQLLFKDGLVEVGVPLNALAHGVPYRLQLLVATAIHADALTQHVQRLDDTGVMKDSAPIADDPPEGVWIRESTTIVRSFPVILSLMVVPRSGISAQTNYRIRARSDCEGCEYKFRISQSTSSELHNTNIISCVDADLARLCSSCSWTELRSWGADPEVWTPLLKGTYVFEVTTRRADGGISRACAGAEATDSGTTARIAAAKSPGEINSLVEWWLSNVSQVTETLQSQGRTDFTVMALHAIAKEFPNAALLRARGALNNSRIIDQLRTHFRDSCDTIKKVVNELHPGAFGPVDGVRALATFNQLRYDLAGANQLQSIVDSVLLSFRAIEVLSQLVDIQSAIQSIDAVLDRNIALRGLLGPEESLNGTQQAFPPCAPKILGLCDSVLKRLTRLGNTTATETSGSTTTLVGLTMDLTRRLGDALAAGLPKDSSRPPSELEAEGNADFTLSVKHFSGKTLLDDGIIVEMPYQITNRPQYPGLVVATMGQSNYANWTASLPSTTTCLGAGVTKPLDAIAYVSIHWARNPHAIGRPGNLNAAPGDKLIMIRDVLLRSCGLSLTIGPALLGGMEKIRQEWELPQQVIEDRRWGYGDLSPFNCVRWAPPDSKLGGASDASGGPTQWWPSNGCNSVYRGPGVGERTDPKWKYLEEGYLRCFCDTLWPTTWAIELVPRPTYSEPPVDEGRSVINLVVFVVPLIVFVLMSCICCAALVDMIYDLDGDRETKRIADALPWLPHGGSREAAAATLGKHIWPVRSDLCQEVLSFTLVLSDLLGTPSSQSLEVEEIAFYRTTKANRATDTFPDTEEARLAFDNSSHPKETSLTYQMPSPDYTLSKVAPDATLPVETNPQSSAVVIREEPASREKRFGLSSHAAAYQGMHPKQEADLAAEPPAITAGQFTRSPRLGASPRLGVSLQPHNGATRPQGNQQRMQDIVRNVNNFDPNPQVKQAKKDVPDPNWDDQVRQQVMRTNAPLNNLTSGSLPEGWIAKRQGADTYYVNLLSGVSSWDYPKLPAIKTLSVSEIRNLLGPDADRISLRTELEDMLRPRIAERLLQLHLDEQMDSTSGHDTEFWGPTPNGVHLPGTAYTEYGRAGAQLRPEPRHWAPPPEKEAPLDSTERSEIRFGSLGSPRPRPAWVESASPPRPLPLLMPEVLHRTAPTQHKTRTGHELRFAARALSDGAGAPVVPEDPDGIILPLSLAFVRWRFFYLVWLCWLRRFPPTAVIIPQIVIPATRFRRVASLCARMSAGYLLATLIAASEQWDKGLEENIIAEDRSVSELLEEFGQSLGTSITISLGVLCYLGAACVLGFLGVPPGTRGDGAHNREVWWHNLQKLQRVNSYVMVAAAFVMYGAACVVASVRPQPRAAIATGAFVPMAALHVLVVPVVCAPLDALTIWLTAHCNCCCVTWLGAFLSQRPALLDFTLAHVHWCDQNEFLKHVEALARERRHATPETSIR